MRTPSLLSFLFCATLAAGCGDDATGDGNNNPDGGNTGGPDAPVGPEADAGPNFPTNDAGQPLCQNKDKVWVVCACSDGMDNDSDGLTDAADPLCTGPFDNDESSFATGIPGDNSSPYVQDCFFDGDSGGGNDGCRWDTRCMDVTEPYEGAHCNNQKLDGCTSCLVLTPNGCDCFGCCDVYVDGVKHTVRIQDGCSPDVINDPAECPPCEQVVGCLNPCDPCEECIGRPEPDPSCMPADGGTGSPCSSGIECTGPDNACPSGYACVTGCCQPIVP